MDVCLKGLVVIVAQLVEPWIVDPVVGGSSPLVHPRLLVSLSYYVHAVVVVPR